MKLSEFRDEKAIEVVAKLLTPIGAIAANAKNVEAKGKTKAAFAGALLQNSPKEVLSILAILDDKEPEEYHCTAASVLSSLLDMLNDPELMRLFGLQSKTQPESGSASENTEGQGS